MSYLITDKGIQITDADGIWHSKVGLAEMAVHDLKKIPLRTVPIKSADLDIFEFSHTLALIENYINEIPVFSINDNYFTPHIFKTESPQRTNVPMSVRLISDIIFPTTKELKDVVFLISAD